MKATHIDGSTGYGIDVGLDNTSFGGFGVGYRITLKLPGGGSTTHCSPNMAEAVIEVFKRAGLLKIAI